MYASTAVSGINHTDTSNIMTNTMAVSVPTVTAPTAWVKRR